MGGFGQQPQQQQIPTAMGSGLGAFGGLGGFGMGGVGGGLGQQQQQQKPFGAPQNAAGQWGFNQQFGAQNPQGGQQQQQQQQQQPQQMSFF